MASGWNLWVWLQCIGVASGCCCKEVYTIIINFPYSTCISSFFGSSIPNSLFIFKMFFRSLVYRVASHSSICKTIILIIIYTIIIACIFVLTLLVWLHFLTVLPLYTILCSFITD